MGGESGSPREAPKPCTCPGRALGRPAKLLSAAAMTPVDDGFCFHFHPPNLQVSFYCPILTQSHPLSHLLPSFSFSVSFDGSSLSLGDQFPGTSFLISSDLMTLNSISLLLMNPDIYLQLRPCPELLICVFRCPLDFSSQMSHRTKQTLECP